MKLTLVILALFFTSFCSFAAEEPTDSLSAENGNLIAEPLLLDYAQANRAPGILVEPYDIIDSDGAY